MLRQGLADETYLSNSTCNNRKDSEVSKKSSKINRVRSSDSLQFSKGKERQEKPASLSQETCSLLRIKKGLRLVVEKEGRVGSFYGGHRGI
jgi:hypothetical protein